MSVSGISLEVMQDAYHYPVIHREVTELLNIGKSKIIIDCTVGIGSHSLIFHKSMPADSLYVGIDKDNESLNIARQRLKAEDKISMPANFTENKNIILIKEDFSNLDIVMRKLNIVGADVIFFDLGISTFQLKDKERGFSFLEEGPLDMRMDRDTFISASSLVNNLSENELEYIFKNFGEERFSKVIARRIIERRKKELITTTDALSNIIINSVPASYHKYKIHPATRVFQALRIAVNRELEILKTSIVKAVSFLNHGGRIGIISFHSLEDRIVKHTFRDLFSQGVLKIITKKPLLPSEEEQRENVSSRSAKFRVAEKI